MKLSQFGRDLLDGLENVFGPHYVPRWLHHTIWGALWVIWIVGAVGFVYERLA